MLKRSNLTTGLCHDIGMLEQNEKAASARLLGGKMKERKNDCNRAGTARLNGNPLNTSKSASTTGRL